MRLARYWAASRLESQYELNWEAGMLDAHSKGKCAGCKRSHKSTLGAPAFCRTVRLESCSKTRGMTVLSSAESKLTVVLHGRPRMDPQPPRSGSSDMQMVAFSTFSAASPCRPDGRAFGARASAEVHRWLNTSSAAAGLAQQHSSTSSAPRD